MGDWSAVDPAAAAQFLGMHPDIAEAYVAMVVSNWAELDPGAARVWVEKQPQSAQTEHSIYGLIVLARIPGVGDEALDPPGFHLDRCL